MKTTNTQYNNSNKSLVKENNTSFDKKKYVSNKRKLNRAIYNVIVFMKYTTICEININIQYNSEL